MRATTLVAMAVTDSTWTPSSWHEFPALQQPDWPDQAALEAVRERLGRLPSLIFAGEARALRHQLGEAQQPGAAARRAVGVRRDQRGGGDAERVGHLAEPLQRDVGAPELEVGEEAAREADGVGELRERQPARLAAGADAGAEPGEKCVVLAARGTARTRAARLGAGRVPGGAGHGGTILLIGPTIRQGVSRILLARPDVPR